jgi:16S rRNA (cytosine1402-N4)-methyltransferase
MFFTCYFNNQVNDELGELFRGLCAAERVVKPGGFIAGTLLFCSQLLQVVSFHSLEDRIVKRFFRACQGKRIDLLTNNDEDQDYFEPH